jgi:hypothetical protein
MFVALKTLLAWLWGFRYGKQSILNIPAFLLVNGVFIFEVSRLHMNSQAANATKTPIGAVLAFGVQAYVFKDKTKPIRQGGLWMKFGLVRRMAASKLLFTGINQAIFTILVIHAGAPYWIIPFMMSPLMGVIHYKVDLWWTFATSLNWQRIVALRGIGAVYYHSNNLWLNWTLGHFDRPKRREVRAAAMLPGPAPSLFFSYPSSGMSS